LHLARIAINKVICKIDAESISRIATTFTKMSFEGGSEPFDYCPGTNSLNTIEPYCELHLGVNLRTPEFLLRRWTELLLHRIILRLNFTELKSELHV
jgi:hypothetical protein